MSMDLYYRPESLGLTIALDVDKSDGGYNFDQFVVWQTQAGDYVWAEDAGCSCPSPFESVSLGDIARGSKADAINDARAWLGQRPTYDISYWEEAKAKIDAWAAGGAQ